MKIAHQDMCGDNLLYTIYDIDDEWSIITRQEIGDNCVYIVYNENGYCLLNKNRQYKYDVSKERNKNE